MQTNTDGVLTEQTPDTSPGETAAAPAGTPIPARQCGAQRKYPPLPPELLEELRLAYAGNRFEVAANLDRISGSTGISKPRLKRVAYEQGWRTCRESRPWTAADLSYLEDSLGSVSLAQISRHLKRSRCAIIHKANLLKRSRKVTTGYNLATLQKCFGLSYPRVLSWARRGLLGKVHGQGGTGHELHVSDANVIRFIRQCPHEYDLSRVDQTWFKAMIFGELADYGDKV